MTKEERTRKAVLLLQQFRGAYMNLCDFWFTEDGEEALTDASFEVGCDYPFFTESFEALGIEQWAWDMMVKLTGDESEVF